MSWQMEAFLSFIPTVAGNAKWIFDRNSNYKIDQYIVAINKSFFYTKITSVTG